MITNLTLTGHLLTKYQPQASGLPEIDALYTHNAIFILFAILCDVTHLSIYMRSTLKLDSNLPFSLENNCRTINRLFEHILVCVIHGNLEDCPEMHR